MAGGDLNTRLISALVLAPVALGAGMAGGFAFAAFVALMAAIAVWEWTGMTVPPVMPVRLLGLALMLVCLLGLVVVPSGWWVALLAAAGLAALASGTQDEGLGWWGAGLLYSGLPCAALITLRDSEPNGWAAILFILAIVWTTDSAAYFGGRTIGGPKLWPRVSPKKTWSGALTGMCAAMLAGGAIAHLTGAASVGTGFLLAGPLSAASQAGDLLESAVKRRFGAKDSGRLIPGHGGVLDRVDGLLGAAALAWLFAAFGAGGHLLALPRQLPVLPGNAP